MAVARQSETTTTTTTTTTVKTTQDTKTNTNQEQTNMNGRQVAQATITTTSPTTTTTSLTTTTTTTPTTEGNQTNCCAGCRMPIKDRFLFSVIEQNFHQDCVRCSDCSTSLNERCYTFDGKLYCRLDYWRRFGPKCSACREAIKPTELVQRLRENLVYHLSCFVCQDCKRHLQAGEQLHLIDERRLLCKKDFMRDVPSINGPSNTRQTNRLLVNIEDAASKENVIEQQQQLLVQGVVQGEQTSLSCSTSPSATSELMQQQQQLLQTHHQLTSGAEVLLMDQEDLDELEADDRSSTADGEQSNGGLGHQPFANHYGRSVVKTESGDLLRGGSQTDCGDELVDANGKRRGPRTTIKPKQLETLRRAFESAPKPSRHIREQLAAETGLNMRVIQVWFQNRRSKERRMKNSNGSARRNFFRSSSRRLRVGPTGATPTATGASAGQQQSLIAGRTNSKQAAAKLQSHSPMSNASDPLAQQGRQQQPQQQHHSPSEYNNSSSGGFTYFSDSSNQGDAFAMATTKQPQSQQTNQQQQQYLSQNGPQQEANLMTLESPTGQQQANAIGQQQQTAARQQQQYGLQSMKNTPPPQQMYPNGPPPPSHMLMCPSSGLPQTQPPLQQQQIPMHHQHAHLGGQIIPQGPPMGMGPLLGGHPQGPSVIQW